MDLSIYIEPESLMLIPVLNLIGYWIKNTGKIKSNFIPIILSVIGIFLCLLKAISEKKYENIFEYAFSALTQGILVSAAAVYSNQVYRQTKTINDKGGKNDGVNE